MRIFKLTFLAEELVKALATSRFNDISFDEIRQHIEGGTIFEFMKNRLGVVEPLRLLGAVHRLELEVEWSNCIAHEGLRLEAPPKGLCLLIEYVLQGIAHRAQVPEYRITPEICSAKFEGDYPPGTTE